MYNEFNTYTTSNTLGAFEIEMRVREQEKKMTLMKALYRIEADGKHKLNHKRSKNPFRALLGIFLTGS